MRFASLGSGSRGNATVIEAEDTRILLDCGFAARELEQRLTRLGLEPAALDAILVTHEHQDHIRGVGALARRFGLPVWMTHGTYRQARCGELPELHLLAAHDGGFRIGGIRVTPFPVPHDAREPAQFLFTAGKLRLGFLTDAGHWTPHILELLAPCDALVLECNHDRNMLAGGPYPPMLQRRVGGEFGHLSNAQAVEFLRRLDGGRLRHLIAAHLSETNNTPQQVRETLLSELPALAASLAVASQDAVTSWFEL